MELAVSSPVDRCATVKSEAEQSLAGKSVAPQSLVGMVLTAVNGQLTNALCFDETMALLRNHASQRPLRLTFADPATVNEEAVASVAGDVEEDETKEGETGAPVSMARLEQELEAVEVPAVAAEQDEAKLQELAEADLPVRS